MVTLNRIYTRTGDKGSTALANGERRSKADLRVEAYGTVDETNACIGLVRLHADIVLDAMLGRIQNDLFDLGADLATPESDEPPAYEPLRIVASQVKADRGGYRRAQCRAVAAEILRVCPAVPRPQPRSISPARYAAGPNA